jgi:hypothetical protein
MTELLNLKDMSDQVRRLDKIFENLVSFLDTCMGHANSCISREESMSAEENPHGNEATSDVDKFISGINDHDPYSDFLDIDRFCRIYPLMTKGNIRRLIHRCKKSKTPFFRYIEYIEVNPLLFFLYLKKYGSVQSKNKLKANNYYGVDLSQSFKGY